ncbi:MAG: DNA/RNA non-specific endonuclease [Bacteroidaceae bacterium]|nr:DNA/RNA non-specific endonuclease [Bacteroidaceae bacterium]
MNKTLKLILTVLALCLLFVAQRYLSTPAIPTTDEEATPASESLSLQGENEEVFSLPKGKDADKGTILVEHEGFTSLFDTRTMCPLWVAWELTADETRGKVTRQGVDFKADESVPEQYQVEMWDYNGGQYGRGHMCPAGDMKWSQRAMQDCHYMTNICPQNAELNKVWWEHLERACRQWARQDGAVQIVCGPVFSDNPKRFGKKHKVAVPKGFYKVVLSLKEGREKALGFYYTNDDAPQPMEDAVRSVDEIERLTGIDFFSSLPDELENRVEAMTDLRAWD